MVGAPTLNLNAGAIYVIFGRSGVFADINLATTSLSTTQQGFKVTGISGSYFGYSVRKAGDVNRDGVDDIVIGALLWLFEQWKYACYIW